MAQASVDVVVQKETSTWVRVSVEGTGGARAVRFTEGQVVRIAATFRDTAGVLVDPTTVVLTVKKPDDTEATPALSNPSDGEYHGTATLDQSGLWRWRYVSTGSVAAEEGHFVVSASDFA